MTNSGRGFRCLLVGTAIAAAMGFSEPARAQVSVDIHLGPPPIVVAEPPALVVIPDSQVYFVPDPQIDVFFYGGYWWSPRGERWYRSRAYNGPWGLIERGRVPRSVVYMPRDYRTRYERGRHVPYGQWKRDHGRWDRENRRSHRRWEKDREREWKRSRKEHGRDDRHRDRDDGRGGDRGGDHDRRGR
jgi:hypothetical protein